MRDDTPQRQARLIDRFALTVCDAVPAGTRKVWLATAEIAAGFATGAEA